MNASDAPSPGGELRSPRVVTIDGPAGCGKSTVVARLSERLGARGVATVGFSTGLVYRGLTWCALERGIDLADARAVRALLGGVELGGVELGGVELGGVELRVVERRGELRVEVDGHDPGEALRTTRVTDAIHWIADDPEVRAALLPLQRALPAGPVILSEGRDLGTVVYPDAAVKVYLTASLEERARRRHSEFRDRLGEEISLEEVQERIRRRDEHDSEREAAPLRPAEDAVVIDTTTLAPEAVVEEILAEFPDDWFPPAAPSGAGGGADE
ncbi:MAG: (d)CMP kinase [Planctomycetota bacterium]